MPAQRLLLGLLFLGLAVTFALIAVGSLLDDTSARQVITALAAGVIAFWLLGLGLGALRRR